MIHYVFSGAPRGEGACGPGDLKIVSAGMCVGIDQLSRKEEVRDDPAAHCARLDLPDADPTAGDDRLLQRTRRADREGQGFQRGSQLLPLRRGDLITGKGSRKTA